VATQQARAALANYNLYHTPPAKLVDWVGFKNFINIFTLSIWRFDKESHRVIGGAIVGTNGGELLGEIGLAIEMGCDAEDIALTIHAHPTLHESVGLAAEVFEGSITDLPNAKAKKK
jgi:pyruvate/2-oxoglutarate dehydrogenase complex dihydrolipoamide dehydrogenase (E3) component